MGIRVRTYLLLLCAFVSFAAQAQMSAREFRVALLLPFKSEGAQSTLSEAMLDYYEGFKLASRDLEQNGLKLKLYVFDSDKDSNSLEDALRHADMKKMDVIIGPVYEADLAITEKFCVKHNIILVSPLKYFVPANNKSTVINFFAPDSLKLSFVAEKCARLYPKHKIYIASDNTKKSQADAALIRKKLLALKMPFVKTLSLTNGKLTPAPANSDSIIIISAISAKDAKSTLLKAVKNKYSSYVIGHLEWNSAIQSTFEINDPQLIYPEVNFVSYHDTFANAFRAQFYDEFYGEPSKYAFIGYDHCTYICYGLMTFGKDFCHHLPYAEFRGLINVIRLEKTEHGLLNQGLNYIQIIDEERIEYEP